MAMEMPAPLLAIGLALAASACASRPGGDNPDTRSTPAPGSSAGPLGVVPGIVDAETARRLVAAGVKVVDVRTQAEFDAGHVPGALNIPFDEVDRRHGEIGPPSTPVLLYCRSGRRSGIATHSLRERGFTQIYDLKAYDLWVRSGSGRR